MKQAGGPVGERVLAGIVAPSGLILVGGVPQGKPWAKLFWPLRATDWRYDRRGKILRRDLL
jgi:hypothetical protein